METEPIHVLQFASSSTWTGETSHVVGLSRALFDIGVRVSFAYRTRKKERTLDLFQDASRKQGLEQVLPLGLDSGFYPREWFRDRVLLQRYVREEGVQIIHCHRSHEHWLSTLAFGRKGPKVLRTRHVVTPVRRDPFNFWLYRRTSHVLTTCSLIRDDLVRSKLCRERQVTVQHGGVDFDSYSDPAEPAAFRSEFRIPPEALLIGAIGHLDPVKGYEKLVRACGELQRRGFDFRLVIVGKEGKQSPESLRRLATEEQIADRVQCTGFREDMPNVIAALDVGVISSTGSEGNSRTALELMAGGKALVSTRVGCLPDLLKHEQTGLLIQPGDIHSLSDALARLLGEADLRDRLGKSAQSWVQENYTWPKVASRVLDIYRRVLEL